MFLLMPTAPGMDGDTEEVREKYYNLMMDRLEEFTGSSIRDRVVVNAVLRTKTSNQNTTVLKATLTALPIH